VQNDGTGAVISALGAGGDPSQGLAKAVEMCNNNGHCRKFDAGTMCPSYRITHDEQHLTRGRANTLRLALSGQISSGQIMADAANPLASQAVHDALDLCVSCKGCKRECPTGVDMAKMKIEATAAYKAQHGLSLRDKLVGYLPHYASLASKFAGLINFAQATFGAALNPMLGFAKQRSLPTWSSHAFKNSEVAQQAAKPQVLLFADTFNRWFEPENLRAAVSVLELAGYGVQVLQGAQNEKPLCCGRTFLSAGLVQQAKDEAARAVAALQPALENGWPIIGLEPSCLFTLRDEFTSYGLGEVAEKIKAQAFLFEEFLEQELQAGRAQGLMERFLSARGKNGTSDNNLKQPNYLIHGHCHQKAFDALTPTQALLKRLPNAKVEMIESSCCGMAGSFGYEAEHYTASMQMAELALLPAVRKASTATVLVADGTSCRHQIADGAGKQAQHVARVLAQSLGLI
jgi:Fe-S oxidoreductase